MTMIFTVTPLPFAVDALEPLMSKMTFEYHWGKHYSGYIAKLNELIADTEYAQYETLEDIMLRADGAIFNNAAQAWNHEFFFAQLSPTPKSEPEGALHTAIVRDFGGFDKFEQSFRAEALSVFGSGWVWLVSDENGRLSIVSTTNAQNPAVQDGLKPLLVADVWEHAYYLDHQNRRPSFIDSLLQLVDWQVIEKRFL